MASPPSPSNPTTYTGHCHCARITYTVTLPRPLDTEPTQITSCNCSICSANGYLLVYAKPDEVVFTKGDLDGLTGYRFEIRRPPLLSLLRQQLVHRLDGVVWHAGLQY